MLYHPVLENISKRNSKYEKRNFESGFHPFEDIFHGEGKKKKIHEIKT